MSCNVLGISAFYHDSSATIIRDGEIIAAVQEERFSRKKHDSSFPANAVRYCLREAGLSVQNLDLVAFYDNPRKKMERLLFTHAFFAPKGARNFLKAVPMWLTEKFWIEALIRKELGANVAVVCFDHHESHAASAFFPSPYDRAAFLTADGVGEWATSSYGVGLDNRIEILAEIRFPHSLGLLYSTFTAFLGFKVNSGEYKVMGLAPYGEPKFVRDILEKMVDLRADGSFALNMEYFDYCTQNRMFSPRMTELFGPPRRPEEPLSQREMDLARSVQEVCEESVLRMARRVKEETGEKYLCLAGGVALNCVANGKLLRSRVFDDIWIQPAASDAGGSLGAAFLGYYKRLNGRAKVKNFQDIQKGSYLGPSYSNEDIKACLNQCGAIYHYLDDKALVDRIADEIACEKIVGWFNGRLEFGPRALGARSILGDARSPAMQKKMNLKIKFRESFRPFAPSVLAEKAGEWFDIDRPSPYMLLVTGVCKEKRRLLTEEEKKLKGLDLLNTVRSYVPAVTHVDYSARVQTVTRERNGLYYEVVRRFYEKTGCPVIVNTSFNVRGEPLVESPHDAYRCFMRTDIDVLAVGNFVLLKEEQPPYKDSGDWRKEFELD